VTTGWMGRGMAPTPPSQGARRMHMHTQDACDGLVVLCNCGAVPEYVPNAAWRCKWGAI